MALKTGDAVKIKIGNYAILSGIIVPGAVLGDDSLIQYKVEYNDYNDEPQVKYFYEAELELANP